MLARKSQLSPRTLPVHERIALQCAKNISKLAAALPKPRTKSGYLPVLVELRRPDEDVIYRYQVNLPPSFVDRDNEQIDEAEANALSQQLNLPCLIHGQTEESSTSPSALMSLDTLDTDAPQLIMMQDAVHIVHDHPDDYPSGSSGASKDAISTFHYSAYASGASKTTRDHFMATLHEMQPSPLQFEVLWADQHDDSEDEEQLQPQLLSAYEPPAPPPPPVSLHSPLEHYPGIENDDGPSTGSESSNGYRVIAPHRPIVRYQPYRPQQAAYPPLPPCIKEDQPVPKPLNGYKQPRRPFRLAYNGGSKRIYQPKRIGIGNGARVASPLPPICSSRGLNGYKPQTQAPQSFYCIPRDYNVKSRPRSRPIAYYQHYPMEEAPPLYAHLPPIDNYGHHFDLQRELQLRKKLEQDLEQQKLLEQQKYQRMLTDSVLSSQMPQELQSKFHWDCCHLCHTEMRTMRNALDHYLSRTHLRRVDAWLVRYSFVKGGLSEDKLQHLRSTGPAVLHCDLCDLKLTSVIHARQHFYGRRHRLVERHISKPNGEGYYDRTGRWVRTNDKWLKCKLCDVIVTSESQLAIHKAGMRHRKRERSATGTSIADTFDGSYMYRIQSDGTLMPLNPFGKYLYASCANKDMLKFNDPNAAFYCELCNVTLNHLKSAKQHEEGRVHRKRVERVSQ